MTDYSLPGPSTKRAYVQGMFARIAPVYDLLNHVLSLGVDVRWRRRAAEAMELTGSERVLDLCCGTGDLAFAVANRIPTGHIIGLDFCEPMVDRAKAKAGSLNPHGNTAFLVGDAQSLPFPAATFDRACVAFGVRNLADPPAGLREIARVLKPGGRLHVLEFSEPTLPGLALGYRCYFRHILPRIGALVSGEAAPYRYLPESVLAFPQREAFFPWMAGAGLTDLACEDLTFGIATLYTGTRPVTAWSSSG